MFGAETFLPMVDDGVAPDLLAGDGVYTVALPTGHRATGTDDSLAGGSRRQFGTGEP